jgi:hypothetical protein
MNSSFQLIPACSFAHGYKLPHTGRALFLSHGMYALVNGEYILLCGNLNELYFRNGWAYFCHMNEIVAGSLLAVRVDMR